LAVDCTSSSEGNGFSLRSVNKTVAGTEALHEFQ